MFFSLIIHTNIHLLYPLKNDQTKMVSQVLLCFHNHQQLLYLESSTSSTRINHTVSEFFSGGAAATIEYLVTNLPTALHSSLQFDVYFL